MLLDLNDFDYTLDESRIAQAPAGRRDESRLMRLDRRTGELKHLQFSQMAGLLRAGDLLVMNNTRVMSARFFARRATGGRIEGLFCCEIEAGLWEAMLKGAGRCKVGETLAIEAAGVGCKSDADRRNCGGAGGSEAETLKIVEAKGRGLYRLALSPAVPAVELLDRVGATPLPPYIHRDASGSRDEDRNRYQTVYASRPGAVAAPTAGLHFTDELLADLREAGVTTTFVTLHVGPGTFAPVEVQDLSQHQMHSEWYELNAAAAEAVNAARRERRRVIAVGTTSVRVLETVARLGGCEQGRCGLAASSGWTNLFLYPPAEFRIVDALVTNFHLPKSTLLMLAAAFCKPGGVEGVAMIKQAYDEAQTEGYRFYSYGDAMFIE